MNNILSVYTIGHGRHPFPEFLSLLEKYEIKFLCDVRNFARSRWFQFNRPILSENLHNNGIGYEHLPECGGKKIALLAELNFGIERILELSAEVKTVIMCSESQPLTKHKIPLLITHYLCHNIRNYKSVFISYKLSRYESLYTK